MWFHSLEPLEDTTWPQLQNLFRQMYSKLGKTCEQLLHAWRSFTFDKNTETIRLLCDTDKTGSNPFRLWRTTDIRSIEEQILTKEKLNKQLTGQTSTSPFMSVRDGTERRVSFNTRDELGEEVDKLTVVMSKLTAREGLLNHKYTKAEVRIDPMAREVTRIGQIVEAGDILQVVVQDRIIEATDLEEIPEGIVDRMIEETTGMKDTITIIEIEIG